MNSIARRFPGVIYEPTFSTQPTGCPYGYTLWHLTALGFLPLEDAQRFLESTMDAHGRVLLEDLHDRIDGAGLLKWTYTTQPKIASVLPPLSGLGIEQLCRLQGTTLLGHYVPYGALEWRIHPLVRSYETWITKVIEEDRR